ncbi:MAG TPA: hypothetical protein PKN61_06920 [Acidobacteriota bacterium]|nr:hypothetical protein [Acidobacteriota bacterium]HNU00453.1 hypothetical protein [Acidobacteriota bacterium]HPB27238.1 hypothetical protein [Acidobacteriota bacterium]HQO24530.1 hypothetical protein [Acidobacteriota bacterium]HQP72413.1 hypothetical protein [Acidobacteriota bacterium]
MKFLIVLAHIFRSTVIGLLPVWFWLAPVSAQGETRELIPAVTREASLPMLAIKADFHLGKTWNESLQPFPALEKRILVVNLTVTNTGTLPQSLYLDEVWLHLKGEDQRVSRVHAEELGPQVYISPQQIFPDSDPGRNSRVQTATPGPVYRDGQVVVNPTHSSGVMVDLGGTKDKTSPTSLQKFVLALFGKEFSASYLKPGQTANGLLYFYLPWEMDSFDGITFHLDEILGGTEQLQLEIAAPPAP